MRRCTRWITCRGKAPAAIVVVQWAGVLSLVALLAGSVALVVVGAVPWSVRRLGIVGSRRCRSRWARFLLSPMVMDHFSARYWCA